MTLEYKKHAWYFADGGASFSTQPIFEGQFILVSDLDGYEFGLFQDIVWDIVNLTDMNLRWQHGEQLFTPEVRAAVSQALAAGPVLYDRIANSVNLMLNGITEEQVQHAEQVTQRWLEDILYASY